MENLISKLHFALLSTQWCLLTVHLALVREDDLAPAAGRVDGQRLLETLLDVGAPDALGIGRREVLVILAVADVQLRLGVGVSARRPGAGGGPRRGNGACGRETCNRGQASVLRVKILAHWLCVGHLRAFTAPALAMDKQLGERWETLRGSDKFINNRS